MKEELENGGGGGEEIGSPHRKAVYSNYSRSTFSVGGSIARGTTVPFAPTRERCVDEFIKHVETPVFN